MASIQVPFNTALADQQLSVDLGDTTYILRAKWNTRAEKWYLSMFDEDNSPIFTGMGFVNNINYLELVTDERMPSGLLYPFNYDDNSSECGRDDLNVSVFLIYDDLED